MTKYLTEIWDYIRLNPKKFVIQAVLALIALWFIFGDFGLVTRVGMELEHRQLEKRQAEEQKKIVAQQNMIQHADHPDSIEKAARERYNFRKKGETVFIIKP
ncbi:MAG: septum formation initiator family protein [Chlorobiaceae bacterium]|nr:septum formation initiator family protein [Chlorobiaceae bacterium]